jgi:hypothetical protein
MSAHKTAISTSKFEAIVAKHGLVVKAKAGSFKAYPKDGSIKRSLDVTTSKKGQTVQVLLVGFEMPEGTIAHPKPPASTVTQMLDFSKDEKLVLRAFFNACKALVKAAKKAAPPAPTKEEVMNDSPAASTPAVEEAAPVAATA